MQAGNQKPVYQLEWPYRQYWQYRGTELTFNLEKNSSTSKTAMRITLAVQGTIYQTSIQCGYHKGTFKL